MRKGPVVSQEQQPKLDYEPHPVPPSAPPPPGRIVRFGVWLSTPRPMVVYYAITFALSILAFVMVILARILIQLFH